MLVCCAWVCHGLKLMVVTTTVKLMVVHDTQLIFAALGELVTGDHASCIIFGAFFCLFFWSVLLWTGVLHLSIPSWRVSMPSVATACLPAVPTCPERLPPFPLLLIDVLNADHLDDNPSGSALEWANRHSGQAHSKRQDPNIWAF